MQKFINGSIDADGLIILYLGEARFHFLSFRTHLQLCSACTYKCALVTSSIITFTTQICVTPYNMPNINTFQALRNWESLLHVFYYRMSIPTVILLAQTDSVFLFRF